jgi:hypothetical protein
MEIKKIEKSLFKALDLQAVRIDEESSQLGWSDLG